MDMNRQAYSESLKNTLSCYQLSSADSLSGPSGYPALAAQLWFKVNLMKIFESCYIAKYYFSILFSVCIVPQNVVYPDGGVNLDKHQVKLLFFFYLSF